MLYAVTFICEWVWSLQFIWFAWTSDTSELVFAGWIRIECKQDLLRSIDFFLRVRLFLDTPYVWWKIHISSRLLVFTEACIEINWNAKTQIKLQQINYITRSDRIIPQLNHTQLIVIWMRVRAKDDWRRNHSHHHYFHLKTKIDDLSFFAFFVCLTWVLIVHVLFAICIMMFFCDVNILVLFLEKAKVFPISIIFEAFQAHQTIWRFKS